MTKNFPGGYYLVLKSNTMVPGDTTLIAIGYMFNTRKVILLTVTEDIWSTKAVITYLYKYTEPFYNFTIRTVARTL